MKYEFNLNKYNYRIVIEQNLVSFYELVTNQLITSYPLEYSVKEVIRSPVFVPNGVALLVSDNDDDQYIIEIHGLRRGESITTNSEYILVLQIDESRSDYLHGYYFGLYEIGEFEINWDKNQKLRNIHFLNKFVKIKSFEYSFVNRGVYHDGHMYLFIRKMDENEKNTYFIEKFNWEPKIELLKSVQIPYIFNCLLMVNGNLVAGDKQGNLHQINLESLKFNFSTRLVKNAITTIFFYNQNLYIGTYDGELISLNLDFKENWLNSISSTHVISIANHNRYLVAVDYHGTYYIINEHNGKVKSKGSLNVEPRSNLSINNSILYVCQGAGFAAYNLRDEKADKEKIINIEFSDPLFRQIHAHNLALLTGDDEGKITLWNYFRVESERFYDGHPLESNFNLN